MPAEILDTTATATLERLFRQLRRAASGDHLSLTAASALRRLTERPHRLTELAGLEGVTQPAMTQLVTRIEREGLATRGTDPDDGRVVLVAITDAGRDLIARRSRARAEHLTALLDRLDPADRETIMAALPALNRLADLSDTLT